MITVIFSALIGAIVTRTVVNFPKIVRSLKTLTQEPVTTVQEKKAPSGEPSAGELVQTGIKRTKNGYTAVYVSRER